MNEMPINDPMRKYTWECPRVGCKKFILSYTEHGLQIFVEQHKSDHAREDREQRENIGAVLDKRIPPDYNILKLTRKDIEFLKTRSIAVDENIEIISEA
jgi:hypothetical protein